MISRWCPDTQGPTYPKNEEPANWRRILSVRIDGGEGMQNIPLFYPDLYITTLINYDTKTHVYTRY